MEKSTSRARRNDSAADANQFKSTLADPAAPPGTISGAVSASDVATDDDALDTVQRAKKRIQEAGNAVRNKVDILPALQDAVVDERNDVLAVINELEDQLDRDQEIRETLERELSSTAEQLQTANTRVQELEWQVVTLQTRVEALEQIRQQVAQVEEELGDANARAHRTKEQLVIAEKERSQLKNDLRAANKQLDELWSIRKERDSLHADHKTLSVRVEDLERTQRELFEERGQLQSELQRVQAGLEDTTAERNQLQMTLRTTEERAREFAQAQESLTEKIDALRTEKKNLQVQITHVERENARLVEQRQFYECEVTSLRNQNRTAEAALTSVKKAFSEVRMALTDTKARARRRTLDTWPRIGSSLRGIAGEDRGIESAAPGTWPMGRIGTPAGAEIGDGMPVAASDPGDEGPDMAASGSADQ